MLKNGIPRNQIIHLAFDDVAGNTQNPFPGKLYNKPDPNGSGRNVYSSKEIDYKGKNATASNFYKVLLGDTSAPGPVLKSNKNSRVFVYYADHGGRGVVCAPYGGDIYADKLNSTLKQAHSKGMFKEMVFYMEACESGSMFPNITSSDKIYAVTAANATESSYAAYCGSSAKVNGKLIGSCLGDLFSVSWMEDTEAHNANTETLSTQFSTVKSKTSASHVQQFGDTSFKSEPIGDFEGVRDPSKASLTEKILTDLVSYK
jgi:legumain